jgi:hypothetical protein
MGLNILKSTTTPSFYLLRPNDQRADNTGEVRWKECEKRVVDRKREERAEDLLERAWEQLQEAHLSLPANLLRPDEHTDSYVGEVDAAAERYIDQLKRIMRLRQEWRGV